MASLHHDTSEDAVAVAAFVASFSSSRCAACRRGSTISQRDIERFFATDAHDFPLNCIACGALTCFGCGTLITSTTNVLSNDTVDGRPLRWHCDRDRTILLWAILCGYDINNVSSSKGHPTQSPSKRVKSDARKGVGYSLEDYHYSAALSEMESDQFDIEDVEIMQNEDTNLDPAQSKKQQPSFPGSVELYIDDNGKMMPVELGKSGVSQSKKEKSSVTKSGKTYADIDLEIMPDEVVMPTIEQSKKNKSPAPMIEKEEATSPHDTLATKAISAVAAILPTPMKSSQLARYDRNPPQILKSLLARSSVLDTAAELLRNNCLEDIARRFPLYNSLNAMIGALSQSSPTLEAILQPRKTKKLGHNLLKVSLPCQIPRSGTHPADEPEEVSAPLLDLLRGMVDQCAAIERSATIHLDAFSDDQSQKMLLLCRNMTTTMESVLASRLSPNGVAIANDRSKDPNAWQKDHAVLGVADDEFRNAHFYDSEAVAITLKTSSIGRMRRILKEVASLKANLPPNIFVRYAESRPDLMKVLIIGPEGTPYENGLFEFDLFCPYDYPQAPPKMHLRTTGRGVVRFNPNLYHTSYVCLSLLGTWSGETWDPAKSTILQVLVSIQAMVFCEKPYCNEPGLQGLEDTERSRAYDRQLYPNVVRFAMLEWTDGKVSEGLHAVSNADATPAFLDDFEEDHLTTFPTTKSASSPGTPTLGPSSPPSFKYPVYTTTHGSWPASPAQDTTTAAEDDTMSSQTTKKKSLSSIYPKKTITHYQSYHLGETGGKLSYTIVPGSKMTAQWTLTEDTIDTQPDMMHGLEPSSSNLEFKGVAAKDDVLMSSLIATQKKLAELKKEVEIMENSKKVQAPRKAKTASPYGGAGSGNSSAAAQDQNMAWKSFFPSSLDLEYKSASTNAEATKLAESMSKKNGKALPSYVATPSNSTLMAQLAAMEGIEQEFMVNAAKCTAKLQELRESTASDKSHQTTSPPSSHGYLPTFGLATASQIPPPPSMVSPPPPSGWIPPPPGYSYLAKSPPLSAGTKLVSVFDDVAKLHFEHNHDKIIKTVQGWVKEKVEFRKSVEAAKKRGARQPAKKRKKMLSDVALSGEAAGEQEEKKEREKEEKELNPSASLRDHLARALKDMADGFGSYYG